MLFSNLYSRCRKLLFGCDTYPDQEVLFNILKGDISFSLKEELGATLAKILSVNGPSHSLSGYSNDAYFANKQATLIINELLEKGISFIDVCGPDFDLQKISSDILTTCRSHKVAVSTGARVQLSRGRKDPDLRKQSFLSSDLLEVASVRKFLTNDLMHRIVSNYLEAPAVVSSVSCWYSYPTAAEPIGFELFHRDRADFRSLNLFIYLSDVDIECGPHEFFPGSHRANSLTSDLTAAAADVEELLCKHRPALGKLKAHYGEPITVTGNKFTAFFEDTRGFHRALQPTTGTRLMFEVVWTLVRQRTGNSSKVPYYGPTPSPLTKHALSHLYNFNY